MAPGISNTNELINIRLQNETNYNPSSLAKRGYLSKSWKWKAGDENATADRIMVRGILIAASANEPDGRLKKLKNIFTTINLRSDENENAVVKINISSLSKRTHTSVSKILFKSVFGGITTNFLEKRVDKLDVKTTRIITTAINKLTKKNKDVREGVVRSLKIHIDQFKNEDNIRYTRFVINNFVFVLEKKEGMITIARQSSQLVGQGKFSIVKGMKDVFSNQIDWVQKIAANDSNELTELVDNEYAIVRDVHNEHNERNIQSQILEPFDIQITKRDGSTETRRSDIARSFDYTFSDKKFRKLPFKKRVEACLEIAKGLKTFHEKGYVHGDLKNDNCSVINGEYQINDLGGAKHSNAIFQDNNPIRVMTPYYTHSEDFNKLRSNNGVIDDNPFEFGQKHDIYSLGMVYLNILSGKDGGRLATAMNRRGVRLDHSIQRAYNKLLPIVKRRSEAAFDLIYDMRKAQNERIDINNVIQRLEAIVNDLNNL